MAESDSRNMAKVATQPEDLKDDYSKEGDSTRLCLPEASEAYIRAIEETLALQPLIFRIANFKKFIEK